MVLSTKTNSCLRYLDQYISHLWVDRPCCVCEMCGYFLVYWSVVVLVTLSYVLLMCIVLNISLCRQIMSLWASRCDPVVWQGAG